MPDETKAREPVSLNKRIAAGLAQLDRGEGIPGDDARRQSHARLAARRAAAERQDVKPR